MDNPDSQASPVGSEWMRLPLRGGRFLGLTRTAIAELCLSGAIDSRLIKRKNAHRGIRLFRVKSLLAFIENNGETAIAFPNGKGANG